MRHAVLACLIVLTFALVPATAGRAAAVTNSKVQAVNINDQDFWVAWYTDQSVSASLSYGTSCSTLDHQSGSFQPATNGYVHLIEAGPSLEAGTTYYYKLNENGTLYGDPNANGDCYKATTFPISQQIGTPTTVTGQVRYPVSSACDGSQEGVLVLLTVSRGSATSQTRATTTSSNGSWEVVVGDIRDSSGNLFNPQNGDTLTITGAGGPSNIKQVSVTFQLPDNAPQDAGTVCLPSAPPNAAGGTPATQTPTLTGVAATATETAIGAVTATATPNSTETATPTLSETATPTPTGTVTPATATPSPTRTITAGTATPTDTIVAASPPTSSPTPTATPTPTIITPTLVPPSTSGSTQGPGAQTKIPIIAKLFPQSFHRGTHAKLNLHTDSLADVRLIVSYSGGGARDWLTGSASLTGFWQAKWVIDVRHKGRAAAQLRVDSGSHRRYYTIHFTIR